MKLLNIHTRLIRPFRSYCGSRAIAGVSSLVYHPVKKATWM
jgi:hypothetical protein